jgi:hypothetical protein
MFAELFHRLLFPTLVAIVVGTVWVVGWSQSLVSEAERGWWPAMPMPNRSAQVSALQSQISQSQTPQDNARSLHQIFLKDDQIIRVR